MKALVVLSGGQDSTTCLFWAIETYGVENVHTLTFNYGQTHNREIWAALTVARIARIPEERRNFVTVPNILVSTSPLLSKEKELEQYGSYDEMIYTVGKRIEKTFVPMRNAFFLTVAVNRAVAAGCENVVIGVSEEDSANYPDCTSQFIEHFESMAKVALRSNIKIYTPLINFSKADTVNFANLLGPQAWNALAYTHTSYANDYPPLDKNHANVLRAKGFEDAGLPDPLIVRAVEDGLMPYPETTNYNELREKI